MFATHRQITAVGLLGCDVNLITVTFHAAFKFPAMNCLARLCNYTGLGLDPTNEQLKQGLEDSKAALARPAPSSGIFTSPEVLGRLATNPTTRAFLGQPDFMQMLQEINRNPQAMSVSSCEGRLGDRG